MKNRESGSQDDEQGSEETQKRIYWKEIYGAVDEVKDALGMPIDEGVKETVVAFNVNGLPTESSCEGHVEERFGKMIKLSPHIGVGFPEPKERFNREAEIKGKIAEKFDVAPDKIWQNDEADKAYWAYIDQHHVSETPEFIELREKNEKLHESFKGILDDFYKERKVEGRKLTTRGIGASGYFYVSTAATADEHYRELEDDDIESAKQELSQEQQEVIDFTEFLKKKYFGEE